MDDPVKIAKGLTKAQREALSSDRRLLQSRWGTAVALRKRGLVTFAPMLRSPTGRAVAEALKEMQDAEAL